MSEQRECRACNGLGCIERALGVPPRVTIMVCAACDGGGVENSSDKMSDEFVGCSPLVSRENIATH